MIKEIEEKVLDIREVTLLSTDEVKSAENNISGISASTEGGWWLRSPGYFVDVAAYVHYDGDVCDEGTPVNRNLGVRPALRIDNLASNDLQIGDKIEVADHTWTVVLDDMALCDDIVAHSPFNKRRESENNYASSDIKRFVGNWAREHDIEKYDARGYYRYEGMYERAISELSTKVEKRDRGYGIIDVNSHPVYRNGQQEHNNLEMLLATPYIFGGRPVYAYAVMPDVGDKNKLTTDLNTFELYTAPDEHTISHMTLIDYCPSGCKSYAEDGNNILLKEQIRDIKAAFVEKQMERHDRYKDLNASPVAGKTKGKVVPQVRENNVAKDDFSDVPKAHAADTKSESKANDRVEQAEAVKSDFAGAETTTPTTGPKF